MLMSRVNECVSCGAEMPEGDHICNRCKASITYEETQVNETELESVRYNFYNALKNTLLYKGIVYICAKLETLLN